jgi:hypothetical protein
VGGFGIGNRVENRDKFNLLAAEAGKKHLRQMLPK